MVSVIYWKDIGFLKYGAQERKFLCSSISWENSMGKSIGFSHGIENFTGGTYPGVKGSFFMKNKFSGSWYKEWAVPAAAERSGRQRPGKKVRSRFPEPPRNARALGESDS